jgi:hypothetical protein
VVVPVGKIDTPDKTASAEIGSRTLACLIWRVAYFGQHRQAPIPSIYQVNGPFRFSAVVALS